MQLTLRTSRMNRRHVTHSLLITRSLEQRRMTEHNHWRSGSRFIPTNIGNILNEDMQ